MEFADNFRLRGTYDVGEIARLLRELPGSAWSRTVADAARVHRHSRGVFLKNDLKPEHLYGRVHPAMSTALGAAVAPIVEDLARKIGPSYAIRVQFSRHQPGHGFDPHTDRYSFTLMHSYRIHIPVVTNPRVWFSVGDERKTLEQGQAWEINNGRVHAGCNEGDGPRIHLIIDLAAPIESAHQRCRYFVNLFHTSRLIGHVQLWSGDDDPGVQATAPDMDAVEDAVESGRVAPGVIVGVNYQIRSHRDGRLIQRETSDEPLVYMHGYRHFPPAFERALAGARVGDSVTVTAGPAEPFGHRDANLQIRLPRSALSPASLRTSWLMPADDAAIPVVFHARTDGSDILLDGNHPLAGMTLDWQLRVRYVRAPEPREARYAVYRGPTLPSLTARLAAVAQLRALSTTALGDRLENLREFSARW